MTRYTATQRGPAPRAPLALVIFAQLLAASALGAGAAYLGTLIGGLIVPVDSSGGFRDVVAQLGGLIAGYPIGVTAGVLLAGLLLGRAGSGWAALAGACLGVGAALLLTPLFAGGATMAGWALLFALGLLGALAGYHRVYRGLRRG
jgi:hypothetical protein